MDVTEFQRQMSEQKERSRTATRAKRLAGGHSHVLYQHVLSLSLPIAGHTLLTHPINASCYRTLSTYLLLLRISQTTTTHPSSPPTDRINTLSTHPVNTPYQPVLSTHYYPPSSPPIGRTALTFGAEQTAYLAKEAMVKPTDDASKYMWDTELSTTVKVLLPHTILYYDHHPITY